MRQKELLRLLSAVLDEANAEIAANRGDGSNLFACGLASEGMAGGYRDALSDVMAAMTHGYPNDPRGYWRNATRKLRHGRQALARARSAVGEDDADYTRDPRNFPENIR